MQRGVTKSKRRPLAIGLIAVFVVLASLLVATQVIGHGQRTVVHDKRGDGGAFEPRTRPKVCDIVKATSELAKEGHLRHAVTVRGKITLSGPILAREVDGLIACMKGVPGVSGVENRLDVHDHPGNHPSLQGGIARTGPRSELCQARWSPTLRVLAGTVGAGLMVNCLAQRDLTSLLMGTLGFGLALRAATNTPVAEGISRAVPAPAEGSEELLTAAAAGPGL